MTNVFLTYFDIARIERTFITERFVGAIPLLRHVCYGATADSLGYGVFDHIWFENPWKNRGCKESITNRLGAPIP